MLMNMTLCLEYIRLTSLQLHSPLLLVGHCLRGREWMQEHCGLRLLSVGRGSVRTAPRTSLWETSTCIYIPLLHACGCWFSPMLLCCLRKVLASWKRFIFVKMREREKIMLHCLLVRFAFFVLPSPSLHACLPCACMYDCVWALWEGCLYACRLALTACGWCVCRCGSEQCCGCVGLARSGSQHVSPAQQRCHGSDLKHCPPPLRPPALQAWHHCDCLA